MLSHRYDKADSNCCIFYYCRILVIVTIIVVFGASTSIIITNLYTTRNIRSNNNNVSNSTTSTNNSTTIHNIDPTICAIDNTPINCSINDSVTRVIPKTCPLKNTNNYCTTTTYTVLDGLDVVQFFTTFRLTNGTYDESRIGLIGHPRFEAIYHNYRFNFINKENKLLFLSNPDYYIPQYGGFCAWAIAGESNYPWSADCIGPSGNKSAWTIINDKLYLFKDMSPKRFFLHDYRYSINAGDARWNQWFGNRILFNTNCTTDHHIH